MGTSPVTITCKTVKSTGATITIKTSADKATSVDFTECAMTAPEHCATTAALTTKEVTTNLVENGGSIYDNFKPTGTVFIEIPVEGSSCAVTGTYKVKGEVAGLMGEAKVYKKSHTLTFTAANEFEQKLTFAGEPATLEGVATLTAPGEYRAS